MQHDNHQPQSPSVTSTPGLEALDGKLDGPRHPDWRTRRILLALAAVGLFGPALVAWSSIIQLPLVGLIATVSCFICIGIVLVAANAQSERLFDLLDALVLILAVAILGSWAATELYFYPAYGTDESAFVQYAAQLLIHGHDPYRANLLPALTQFHVPIQYATYKLNGTIASTLSYPALSFLLVVPAVLLTGGTQAVIGENAVFLAAELVLMFFFLPKHYRALSTVVVLGLPFLFDYTLGGDIITFSIPFLLVVAYRWSDIGRSGRLGSGGILRCICLGAALSISQIPWFIAPFLILGLWRLRTREIGTRDTAKVMARISIIAGGTFVAINGPFIIAGPRAWISGIFAPLTQGAIPFGQGLIDLTAFFRIGGGRLSDYTYAAVCVFLGLLIAYLIFFRIMGRVAFVLPSLVFLFSTRSLSEYFIMVVALWIVTIASPGSSLTNYERAPTEVGRHVQRTTHDRTAILTTTAVLALPVIGAICFVALALTTAAPLDIRIQSVQTNGQFRAIWRIRALVTNSSTHMLVPHFATDASGYMTTYWNLVSGPRTLGPGKRAVYTLVAPNVGSMPGVTQPFVLQAVTASPPTISSSALLTPEQFESYISPSYVDRIVPLGDSVTLSVALRSPYGAPVHRRGIPIALGQVIYGQNTLIPGEAQIDDAAVGKSPVVASTNGAGTATFRIRDSYVQGGNPVYFQAYVDPGNGFPYGYSEIVSVQWSLHASSNH
jgi:uncharacterized membrane protein